MVDLIRKLHTHTSNIFYMFPFIFLLSNLYYFRAKDDKCHYSPKNKGATDKGYVDIESGNEMHLKAAVATIGPVSVAIDASHETFQLYSGGKIWIT